MIRTAVSLSLIALILTANLTSKAARADEGMWLFEDLPQELLKEKYGFEPTDEWAEHIRLASVRFNTGGSASFVSSTGLVLTNHHVAESTLHKLSSAENDYIKHGFLAKTQQEELKAPDLELNQLVSIEDVTERVNAAVTDDMGSKEANLARRAVMATIEKESLAETNLRSDVITLYGGAKYHLYRYKKYTDVRLVWAPEAASAFFGGDNDNFEYPRYCLDVTLFRVYENGKPAQVDHFLKWSNNGAEDGELVFVSGNPGYTERDKTADALRFTRDYLMAEYLNMFCRMEIETQQFSNESPEHRRRAHKLLFGLQNNRKRFLGMSEGLQNPQLIAAKESSEREFRQRLAARDDLKHYSDAWDRVSAVEADFKQLQPRTYRLFSTYYDIALDLVLMATEDEKPNEDRYKEFRDSGRESLEHELFSPAPIYDDLEMTKLAASLSMLAAKRGGDDPLVKTALASKSPRTRAAELVSGSKLADVSVRKQLAAGGNAAIEASEDPMIQFIRAIEPEYRSVRDRHEELRESEKQAYADIREAKTALDGASGYPDATFTLRLAFGVVKGYEEDGQQVPPWTDIAGAFRHQEVHESKEPWILPSSWHDARDKVDGSARLNFVSTADIIGGNSGSPVVNRAGEFVGIIFDGNIQSLTASYYYDDTISRATSVHSAAIREAIRNIYSAPQLADELGR